MYSQQIVRDVHCKYVLQGFRATGLLSVVLRYLGHGSWTCAVNIQVIMRAMMSPSASHRPNPRPASRSVLPPPPTYYCPVHNLLHLKSNLLPG